MAKVAKRFGVSVASVMRWSKSIEAIKERNRDPLKLIWKPLNVMLSSIQTSTNLSELGGWELVNTAYGIPLKKPELRIRNCIKAKQVLR